MCLLDCVYWLLFQIENAKKKKIFKILKYEKIVLHVHVHVVGRADDGCMYCRRRGHLTKKNQRAHVMYLLGGHGNHHTLYYIIIAMCVLGIMPK